MGRFGKKFTVRQPKKRLETIPGLLRKRGKKPVGRLKVGDIFAFSPAGTHYTIIYKVGDTVYYSTLKDMKSVEKTKLVHDVPVGGA